MCDSIGLLAHAKKNVVILAEIKLGTEATDGESQITAEHHQVGDVVLSKNEIGRPIGLAIIFAMLTARIEFVFVGEQSDCSRAMAYSEMIPYR